MKNIFAKFQDYVKKPNRNTFDLSFYNNLTLKFGELTPVFCKEVIPGDSFRINTAFGLQLMPMKFPVQTPMRAYIHYFYVRNRTIWKDWMDFIGGTKEGLTPPYIAPVDKKKFYRVGGLADYFGVPNTLYNDESNSTISEYPIIGASQTITLDEQSYSISLNPFSTTLWCDYNFLHYISKNNLDNIGSEDNWFTSFVTNARNQLIGTHPNSSFTNLNPNFLPNPWGAMKTLNEDVSDYKLARFIPWSKIADVNINNNVVFGSVNFTCSVRSTYNVNKIPVICVGRDSDNVIRYVGGALVDVTFSEDTHTTSAGTFKEMYFSFGALALAENVVRYEYFCIMPSACGYSSDTVTYVGQLEQAFSFKAEYGVNSVQSVNIIGDVPFDSTPYDSDIHLNALPFRAYEAIYNAYYRNPQNNPFILNGTPEYNRYNTTYEGGADSTDYDLYFRNWEYDFLTSAVQSPQQGTAPLVGISVTGEATFQDEDGNTYYAQAILNDQGEITGWQSHSSNMPTGSLRLLLDMAGSGISINDLRNVNAFQRFLENNIRRGLKYRDQLMSHFGVKARYDELDMPEFIGGCSTSVNVNKLSQTSESDVTPLGSFVGQASAFGQSKHSITHYCDEHGFIIGIMSVVPVPVYSQLLPKFFIKSQQLDYYYPEFGHIGYQPIQQKEVSPLQTYYSGNDLNKVFGYNRAWYDYLASTDEVHGQFRTTMRDFLMNRTFKDEPELSEEFLLVDPNQLNDVFLSGTDDNDLYAPESDKIIGSIYFDVSAKRPIPLFGIPKLTE